MANEKGLKAKNVNLLPSTMSLPRRRCVTKPIPRVITGLVWSFCNGGKLTCCLATFCATVSADLAADNPDFDPICKTGRAFYAGDLWVVSLALRLIMESPTGICVMPGTGV